MIIGSYALKQYGYDNNHRDIDLLVDKNIYIELLLKCNTKNGNILRFSDDSNIYDVTLIENESDKLIMDYCKKNNKLTSISIHNIEFLIPPLKILYVIKNLIFIVFCLLQAI